MTDSDDWEATKIKPAWKPQEKIDPSRWSITVPQSNNTEPFKNLGEIEMDERGRVSFGRVGKRGKARYLVEEGPTGELHLIPLLSVPVRVPSSTTEQEFGWINREIPF